MSGIVQNNILRSSGIIAVSAAGLNWNSTVITGSTVTVESGNGYWINTTSNTCTITLPSSAEAGDQIVLIDYLRTWGTNKIIIDSNGLNYQGNPDTYTVEYTTSGQSLNIVYSDATKGWIPLDDDVAALEPVAPTTQRAIFAYGFNGSNLSMSNLVNSSGVIGTDVSGVGTARRGLTAANYGGDKAIFAYGYTNTEFSASNLVNNSGVIGSDVSGVGTARDGLAAATYGTDKAIFGYGYGTANMTNLVNSSGVVGSDVTGVGTGRTHLAATGYGSSGQAIFCFGVGGSEAQINLKNLVSNQGVVAADASGVGTARYGLRATTYGGDKAIVAYGNTGPASYPNQNISNKISNQGVVASDTSGVGTARNYAAASSYGGDKGVYAFGTASSYTNVKNLVNNSGVISADVTGVGTARRQLGAAGYSYSA